MRRALTAIPPDVGVRLQVTPEPGEPDFLEAELVVDGVGLPAFDYGPLDLVELNGLSHSSAARAAAVG